MCSLSCVCLQQLLEGFPRTCTFPTPRQVEDWLLSNGPPLHTSDDLLEFDEVHPHIQKALNLMGRLAATWKSPDLMDQVHVDLGTGEPASSPYHGPGNVQPVPRAFNMVKMGGFHAVAKLLLVCILENNQVDEEGKDIAPNPDDINGASCLFNTLAPLDCKSSRRHTLDRNAKMKFREDLEIFLNWLENGDDSYNWKSALPPADIDSSWHNIACLLRLPRLNAWHDSCAPTSQSGMTSWSRITKASQHCSSTRAGPRRSLLAWRLWPSRGCVSCAAVRTVSAARRQGWECSRSGLRSSVLKATSWGRTARWGFGTSSQTCRQPSDLRAIPSARHWQPTSATERRTASQETVPKVPTARTSPSNSGLSIDSEGGTAHLLSLLSWTSSVRRCKTSGTGWRREGCLQVSEPLGSPALAWWFCGVRTRQA